MPSFLPGLALATMVGGWIGTALGSQRLPVTTDWRLLAVVLIVAGLKMLVA